MSKQHGIVGYENLRTHYEITVFGDLVWKVRKQTNSHMDVEHMHGQ